MCLTFWPLIVDNIPLYHYKTMFPLSFPSPSHDLEYLLASLHYMYSGTSFIRTLWFPVKIVRIGEASGYLKCYDLSSKKKS